MFFIPLTAKHNNLSSSNSDALTAKHYLSSSNINALGTCQRRTDGTVK